MVMKFGPFLESIMGVLEEIGVIYLLSISSPFESVQRVPLALKLSKNYQLTVTSFPYLSSIGIPLSSTSNSIISYNTLGENLTFIIAFSLLLPPSYIIVHWSILRPFSKVTSSYT